jgi:glycosyltransferase involved in cell wall biosynthesis
MSDAIRTNECSLLPLAIIVPVYRNAETLEELAGRVCATLADSIRDYRLIFVVDASPDDSWAKVCELASSDERVAGILLTRNVGQHRALLAGLSSLRAEWYAILDADLQDPPELLKAMLDRARSRGGSVFAGREGAYQSWGRMLSSRVFKRLLGWWVGLPANVGTYLVIPDAVARSMINLNSRHPHMVVMARHCSPSWSVLPYRREARVHGYSAYSTMGRIRAAWLALRCAWECYRCTSPVAVQKAG